MKKSIFKWVVISSSVIFVLASFLICSCAQNLSEPEAPQAQLPQLISISDDVITNQNQSVTLTVTSEVSDGGKLSYQWYSAEDKLSQGYLIEQADDFEYLPDAKQAGSKYYYCIVTNTLQADKKSITTPRIQVIVIPGINAKSPVIAVQPINISGVLQEDFAFTVYAVSVDEGELSYQWYFSTIKDGKFTAIPNATDSSFGSKLSLLNLGYYYCIITNTIKNNGDGGTKTAFAITNKVVLSNNIVNANPPTILIQPQELSGTLGQGFTFAVKASPADEGSLSYQWYYYAGTVETAVAIPDATLPNYSAKINNTNNGYYYCVVTNTIEDNGDGGKKSAWVQTKSVKLEKIIVNAAIPQILAQPAGTTLILPAEYTLTLGALATDGGNLSYQWYSISSEENASESIISGANNPNLHVNANEPMNFGYYCVITNTIEDNGDGGKKSASIKSATATIQAVDFTDTLSDLIITKQPEKMNIAPSDTKFVTLEFGAELETGYKIPINYQWYETVDETVESGQKVTGGEGSNLSTFTIPAFTEKGIKYYYCVASITLSKYDGTLVTKSVVSDVVSVAYTGLPTLYLNTEVPTVSITKNDYAFGDFKLITSDFGTTEYTFSKEKNGEKKEGVKGRGNTSWTMSKKCYSIKFDTKQSFFGLPKAKKWCIIANYSDKTLLRNRFASIMGNEIFNAEWNPSFVSVDVVMNGEYMGNYIFCERNTICEGRIDVQDISDVEEKLAEGKESKITDANNDGVKDLKDGGFLIEVEGNEGRAKENNFYFASTQGVRFFVLKDPDEVSEKIQNQVKSIILNAESVLYGESFADNENGWRKYIDEDSVIDWYLMNEFTKNNDSIFFGSVYLYYNPSDQKLHLGPIWDFDISCGNINYNGCDSSSDFWVKKSIWISRMFEDSEFVSNVKLRWDDKKSDLTQFVNFELQHLAQENLVSFDYNFIKWHILGTYVWPNENGYEARTTYQSELDYMINWLSERFNWLDEAINNL